MRLFCPFLLLFMTIYPTDGWGNIYKGTSKDIIEYNTVEDTPKDRCSESTSRVDFSNITVLKIKTKVMKKRYYRGTGSNMGGSGSNSSSHGRSSSYVWALLKADISSVDGYAGYTRVILNGVVREKLVIRTAVLSGSIKSGETKVLSQRLRIPRMALKKIFKWEIREVYTSKRKGRWIRKMAVYNSRFQIE